MGLFDIFRKKEHNKEDNLPIFEKMFFDIQAAVDNDDERTLKELCTEEMFISLMKGKADNVRNGATNIVEDIEIKHRFTVDAYYDGDVLQDFHEVHFQFTVSDYYINDSGELLPGSSKDPQFIEEVWVFTRSVYSKDNSWYLSDIELLEN